MTLIAAADGSALGNPGPAGWGWYVDRDRWASGGWAHGTNNMGELMAVLDLLRQTAHLGEPLHVLCDSKYVIDSITKWMPGWKRNGWRKKDKKPVLNLELMQAIDAAMRPDVTFEWVKGHAGHALNEAADRLANAAAQAYQRGDVPPAGPGIPGADAQQEASTVQASPSTREPEPEPDLFSSLEDEPVPARSAVEEVVALERRLLDDEVRADRGEVAALLHPQWMEIGRSGRVWNRTEMLDTIGPIGRVDLEVVDVIEVGADTVQLLWRATTEQGSTLRSSLWVRGRTGWQQVFHQGTPEA
ncbi:MAG: RNase H family protein [Nocardioides sp.]|uniref:RNase H family protein n=1 Tax=Nocardioides sp. TaxID=35761 RepID=UPI003F053E3F